MGGRVMIMFVTEQVPGRAGGVGAAERGVPF